MENEAIRSKAIAITITTTAVEEGNRFRFEDIFETDANATVVGQLAQRMRVFAARLAGRLVDAQYLAFRLQIATMVVKVPQYIVPHTDA